ncbi:MAG: cytochrome C oxidase subunit IV family protein [Planctomycetota bacterium]
MSHDHHDEHHNEIAHVMPLWMLFATFAALVVLTCVTVFVGLNFELGAWEIWVSLGIATAKAALVTLLFMHLAYDKPLNLAIFAFSLLFVLLFLGFTMVDAAAYKTELDAGDALRSSQ